MKGAEFNKTLDKFLKSQAQNDIYFWEELSQKYRTIKAITTQIKDSINNIFELNKDNWDNNVREYEQIYLRKYGTYFTNFVIENEEAYARYKKQDFSNKVEVISHYNRLNSIAKDIGKVSVEALSRLKKFQNTSNPKEVEKLKSFILQPLDRIIQDSEEKINFIQSK